MSRGVLDIMFEKVIAEVAQKLRPHGFERHGKVIKAISNGNAAIIEFQKSDKSTEHQIVFTINVGVVCGDLLDADRISIKKSTIIDAHLRNRLGMLLTTPHDTWWELTALTDYDSLANELSGLLLAKAIPYLESYMNTDALVALWESEKSPGLTAAQRSRFLSELKGKRLDSSH